MYNTRLRDEILEKVDLVDVISEVVNLKRRGANYVGLCPFHNEKTPSFTVSPDKGLYKCFGCGKAGNVFTFMQDYYNLTFPEAMRELSTKAGLQFEENVSPEAAREMSRQEKVSKALEYANIFYQNSLSDKIGAEAMAYFRRRGFDNAIIEKFGLGFSPAEWNELQKFLNGMNFSNEDLLDAGLLIKKEGAEKYWDRFRGRAMFPIMSPTGKVIGFGARDFSKVRPYNSPKYLNSPQTIVYDKSNAIYGLFQAKNEIRNKKYVILSEGYADVISLHKAGFSQAIASCGTSLTTGQLRILLRYAGKLYISYDGDSAGINASLKAIELALPLGFDVNVVSLPDGEDPDSVIEKHGEQMYRRCLDDAKPFVDFIYEQRKKNDELKSPKEKSDFVRYVVKLITSIPDRLQHDFFIRRVATLMNLTENQLRDLYRNKTNIENTVRQNENKIIPLRADDSRSDYNGGAGNPEQSGATLVSLMPEETLSAAEIALFRTLADFPEMMPYCVEKLGVSENNFESDLSKEVFSTLKKIHERKHTLQYIPEMEESDYDDSVVQFLIDMVMNRETPSDKWKDFYTTDVVFDRKKIVSDALITIELRKTERNLNELSSKPELTGEELQKVVELTMRRNKLKDSLNSTE